MSSPACTLRTERRAGLGDLAPAWDALVERQPLPSPFLRSWWVEGATGHRPCVVVVLDGDRLIGGLAMEEDRRAGVSRLLAAGSALAPDHVDLIAEPGREADVIAGLAEWFGRPGARLVDLSCTVGDPRVSAALPGASCTVVESAPWTPLSGDFDAFFAALPSRERHKLSRTSRRLRAEGAQHVRVDAAGVEAALGELRRLHSRVFADRSFFLPYFDRFSAAARLGVPVGELVLNQLVADGTVVAALVTFELSQRLSFYQGGRDTDRRWSGAGVYLRLCVIEQAFQDGMVELDRLRGQVEYKSLWAPERRPLARVVATNGPLARTALRAYDVATGQLGAVARRVRQRWAGRGR